MEIGRSRAMDYGQADMVDESEAPEWWMLYSFPISNIKVSCRLYVSQARTAERNDLQIQH